VPPPVDAAAVTVVDAGAPDAGPSFLALATVGDEAEKYLFPEASAPADVEGRAQACPNTAPARERVLCLLDLRYAKDAAAQATARELYATHGILAGLEPEHSERMGWRGTIHLVPEPPIGKYRAHLDWMLTSAKDFERVFALVDPKGAHRYRWRPVVLRFMRSVDRTTPSGTAAPDRWEVSYNVVGSLNKSEESVRELVFHELFHRNDSDADGWSTRVLDPIYRTILAKCRSESNMPCLAAYTPTSTTVRGGTYYAFQPADYNPVLEYAAELAVRWYREQRAIVLKLPRVAPFKCGPPQNARAWEAITRDFFGGADLVPACS
jgi:hypothetical protein